MKRIALTVLSLGLVAAGVAQPASSATKPVPTTLYFHSVDNMGTGNGNVNFIAGDSATGILPMDSKAPTSTTTQDYGTFSAANNPNHSCFGNGLTMHPTWQGPTAGTLTGEVTVTFFARATPGNATVQLFADAPDDQLCNADFPVAFAETTVALASTPDFSKVTATFKLTKPIVVKGSLSVMIQNENVATPQGSDVGFDSTAAPSAIAFSCAPAKGKTC